jgi:dolichol-phosphate mannosyltransferase
MVDDGSPDNAWHIITSLATRDKRVKGIKLSRNFGQHYAITAGLDFAKGRWVVVMDADLQDQPEEIVKLYNKAQEGYDIVVGKRVERKDTFIKKITSKLFFTIYSYLTDTNIDGSISNFGIYSHKVINSLKSFKEHTRSFGLFAIWVGFTRIEIAIEHSNRKKGKSSYSIKKLFTLALDSIISHSDKPLKLFLTSGFMLSFLSFLYAIFLVIQFYIFSIPVTGWTSLMVSIYFLGGIIIACMGIIGLYLNKIYDEAKNRPLYIIAATTFKE